ncbi:MAG: CDP-diacylglycerol--glycerol-3-phosphate 3-phosphatidyltransferase [Spirochaetes bacterium]|nr:MAG: CDP-diacylglycerol--glycerol-3-phosphate 3-phosphatidyltransferase [Spirochaetota bacterium]
MNLPNKLTIGRLIMSPVFYIAYFIPLWTGRFAGLSVYVLAVIFLAIEISDFLDGYIARKYDIVSDLGKVLDPFADVVSRLTYFLCFASTGIMPMWVFLVLMYRELGIIFFRMVMMKKGVVVAASIWGKLKAITYAVAGVLGVLVVFIQRTGFLSGISAGLTVVTLVVFIAAAVASVASFITYIIAARNL